MGRHRRGAADREADRAARRGGSARRLLGGVPLARHQRPDRRPWPADGEPQQDSPVNRRRRRTGIKARRLHMKVFTLRAIATALITLWSLASVQAQDYPTKPVRFVVP